VEFSYEAMPNPVSVRYFKTSPEIIQLVVMLYVRFPLSLRNVEDLLHERGVDVSYESVRYWWHRFGSQFASQIKKRRAGGMQSSNWKRHLGCASHFQFQLKFPKTFDAWLLRSALSRPLILLTHGGKSIDPDHKLDERCSQQIKSPTASKPNSPTADDPVYCALASATVLPSQT